MVRILACGSLVIALAGLGGCGLGSGSPSVVNKTTTAVKATGSVYGAQSPDTGATIQVWQVGTTGFGLGANSLMGSGVTVTTSDGTGTMDSNANQGNANNTLPAGQFTLNFTNAYTCPTTGSPLVYITATGGNPGLGGTVNNSAIVMMTAIGQCSSLTSTTFISLNEVVTAGTVENLSTFLSAGGSIGSPSDSVSLQAISNAFAAVSSMVNTSTGSALGGFPKLNTLANAVVQCVNSTGPTSTNCASLFADATPSGGTAPTTVLGALLDVALNPTLNSTAIFNLSTPNAPFQPALTSAPGLWNITTASAAKSACGAGGGGDDVSGTIAYSGSKTGWVYIAINNPNGCDVGTQGTSVYVSAPGSYPYTIHGVPIGSNYTLQAFMDTLGYGAENAADPAGSTYPIGVGNPNVTGANVTLVDPGTVTVTFAPSIISAGGYNSGAIVEYYAATNGINGTETPTSYTLQWSTSLSFASVAGSKTFPSTGNGITVWLVNGLTDGSVYYFRAYGTSAGTPVGPYSAVYGPVTVGLPSSGSTVSGAVSFTGPATGPLYTGFYDQNNPGVPITLESITGPVSAQAFSVAVPNSASGVYIPVGVIDQNNDGIIDAGDITNVGFQGGPIAVTGPTANQNLTLPTGNVTANLTTQVIQSGGTTRYGLYFNLAFLAKQPVAVTLLNSYNTDGASIDSGPLDIANCAVAGTNCSNGSSGFQIYFNLGSTAPTTGDTYLFNVTYSDGTSGIVAAQVTNVVTTFATNLAPQTGTSTTPTFTWTNPVCGACATYTDTFYINNSSGATLWFVPGNGNGLPPGTSSLTWAVDPTNSSHLPSVGSLTLGSTYSWAVTVQDSLYNAATTVVSYQP